MQHNVRCRIFHSSILHYSQINEWLPKPAKIWHCNNYKLQEKVITDHIPHYNEMFVIWEYKKLLLNGRNSINKKMYKYIAFGKNEYKRTFGNE